MMNEIQGTVILHISFAMKQEQVLGNALFRHLRNNSTLLRPFLISLLCSVARIPSLEDKVC
jgi:fanconi anemia group I protein